MAAVAVQGRLYTWDDGSTFKVSAQVAGEYLDTLRKQHGGVLAPEDVVEAAKSADSPIHGEFTWDVEKAAFQHWKARARNMMSHLSIQEFSEQDPRDSAPAMVNLVVTTFTETRRGYVSLEQVFSDEELRQQAIDQCLKLLSGIKRRFSVFEELEDVRTAIAKAEEKRAKSKKYKKSKKK